MISELLTHLVQNPVAILDALQAVTYVAAAALSSHNGHRDLSACYAFSAFLHSGVAASHFFNIG